MPGEEFIPQAQHVYVISNSKVAADLILFYIDGADNDYYLGFVLQLHQHLQLTVRLEPWQHAAGVVVVEEFASEFHVEFVAEMGDTLLDLLRLDFEIFLVVEPVFHIKVMC